MQHADLPDAGRVSHFEIDAWLPAPNEKAALVGDPVPAGDANRYLTQNHAAGGFDGFANPAASVGLVAVNGVATTAMRSDGAPSLDQGIIPTWTGLHTYGAGLAVSAGQGIAMADETCWFGIGAALERINVNAAGYLSVMGANFGVGAAVPISLFDVSASNGNTVASIACYDDGASESRFYLRKSDTDTIGTLAQTDDGDWLGLAGFQGVTSTPGWGYGVLIYAVQRGVAGVTYIETDLIFQTYSATGGNANQLVLDGGTGNVGFGTLDPDRLTHAEASTAETVAIVYANRLSHTTSGAAAPLFGVGQEHELEDAGGAMQVASEVVTLWAASTAGAESPLYRGTTYPAGAAGPGYWGFWTWDNLDDDARTIVPNGAGDVASGVTIVYRLSESGGGSEGNVVMVANGGTVDLYDDGTDVFTLTVNADGSVTVVRSAGATTADLALLMCWL